MNKWIKYLIIGGIAYYAYTLYKKKSEYKYLYSHPEEVGPPAPPKTVATATPFYQYFPGQTSPGPFKPPTA